jgi:hypothetical protein
MFSGLCALLLAGCASEPPRLVLHMEAPPGTSASKAATPTVAPTTAAPGLADDFLRTAALQPAPRADGEGWVPLFDGKTLSGWEATDFGGHGEVAVQNTLMLLNMGDPLTGVNWTNRLPKMDYEITLEAMRVNGSDFFCGLTVPVNDSFCSLIVGGWGGSLVGISSLDGEDASENETTKFMDFAERKWYGVRLRVTEGRIEGWIDREKLVDVVTTDRRISLRPGDIEMSKPLGIASYQTTAAIRNIQMRRVSTPADPAKEKR